MNENTTCRIGIGGPVGSGKTALIEAITPRLLDMGYKVLVITNDVVLIESGGDNLTLTFSPALVDFFIYVIDVAAGDKIPRKDGPGISQSDILVINKTDLAPYVRADLEVMRRDSELMRPGKPFVFTNCMTGEGIDELVALIRRMALFDLGNNKEKVSESLTGAVR